MAGLCPVFVTCSMRLRLLHIETKMAEVRPEIPIRKNRIKITQSISDGGLTQWFATRVVEEDFITSARQFCTLGVPDFIQVTQMLGAVESKLKTMHMQLQDTPKETLKSILCLI